jgi:tripartite motif-containing protein 71
MVGMRKTGRAAAVLAAALSAGALASCASPLLARINEEIARAPFTGTKYAFTRQWGNTAPEYSFYRPIVKTDTAGFVYVADSSYRVRKFNAAGVLQSTVSGESSKGVGARIYDMAFDSSGNMYVTTNDTATVQKYDVSGNLLLQWGAATDLYPPAGGVALSVPRGIAVDTAGNVYVVDYGNHRVVQFSSTGGFMAEWGRSEKYPLPTDTFMYHPNGIAVDASGNVYVVDAGNDRVLKFTSAGVFLNESSGVTMNSPSSVALGVSGSVTSVYVTDTYNDQIARFGTSLSFVSVWGDSTSFSYPESLAVDTTGAVYVADGSSMDKGRIQKFDVSSTPVLTTTWKSGSGSDNGLVLAPWGVAFDPSGNVIVTEIGNNRLQKFDAAGAFSAAWGSAGSGAGQFSFPISVAITGAGVIYVADMSNRRYQVLDASGTATATVGSAGTGNGFFGAPMSLDYDASGNVYVMDAGNALVQIFSPNGYFIKQWGTKGTDAGQFTVGGTYGIAVDRTGAGAVYVSDYVANRIQKFDLAGTYLSAVGTAGSGDGELNAPIGMAVDPAGNLYVCDMMNHRVQKFDSAGKFLAAFGGPGAGNGTFGWPVGVAVNASGTVVVTDYVGSLVQEFDPTF